MEKLKELVEQLCDGEMESDQPGRWIGKTSPGNRTAGEKAVAFGDKVWQAMTIQEQMGIRLCISIDWDGAFEMPSLYGAVELRVVPHELLINIHNITEGRISSIHDPATVQRWLAVAFARDLMTTIKAQVPEKRVEEMLARQEGRILVSIGEELRYVIREERGNYGLTLLLRVGVCLDEVNA